MKPRDAVEFANGASPGREAAILRNNGRNSETDENLQ